MFPYISILFSFLFIALGDIFTKKWVIFHHTYYVLIAFIFYGSSTLSYLPLMRAKGLIVSTLFWTLGTLFIGMGVGLFYNEHLSTVKIIGIILGILSITLLCI